MNKNTRKFKKNSDISKLKKEYFSSNEEIEPPANSFIMDLFQTQRFSKEKNK